MQITLVKQLMILEILYKMMYKKRIF